MGGSSKAASLTGAGENSLPLRGTPPRGGSARHPGSPGVPSLTSARFQPPAHPHTLCLGPAPSHSFCGDVSETGPRDRLWSRSPKSTPRPSTCSPGERPLGVNPAEKPPGPPHIWTSARSPTGTALPGETVAGPCSRDPCTWVERAQTEGPLRNKQLVPSRLRPGGNNQSNAIISQTRTCGCSGSAGELL